jgi:dihydroflavonol-4-reductase
MRVFVTGGNGFIGSAVVRALARAGHEIVCLLRPTSNTDRIDSVRYESTMGDVRDLTSLREGVEGCDAIIHLASLSSWDVIDSPEMRDVVLGGTLNVLEAAQEARARMVFVSSITAIDGTKDARILDETAVFTLGEANGLTYAKLKHQAERLCLDKARDGVPVVIVNPGETYGPGDTELITAGNLVDFVTSNCNPVLIPAGGTSISYVDDVALGIVRALEAGRAGERYILGGENVDYTTLAQLTLEFAGKKSRIVIIPNRLFLGVTKVATSLRIPLPYQPKAIPYGTRYFYADSRKAAQELGVKFRSARDTIGPTVAWLRESGRIP